MAERLLRCGSDRYDCGQTTQIVHNLFEIGAFCVMRGVQPAVDVLPSRYGRQTPKTGAAAREYSPHCTLARRLQDYPFPRRQRVCGRSFRAASVPILLVTALEIEQAREVANGRAINGCVRIEFRGNWVRQIIPAASSNRRQTPVVLNELQE